MWRRVRGGGVRGYADQGVEEVGELGGRVGGEAAVHRSGLNDGGSGGGEPAEALAERPAGQRALGAGLLERGQARPYRVEVGGGVDGQQAGLVELDPGAQVAEGVRVDDHAHVDGFAPLDPRHHPDQRVLEDVGSRHGRITSGTTGARCRRCST
jgi:hypothetical protein